MHWFLSNTVRHKGDGGSQRSCELPDSERLRRLNAPLGNFLFHEPPSSHEYSSCLKLLVYLLRVAGCHSHRRQMNPGRLKRFFQHKNGPAKRALAVREILHHIFKNNDRRTNVICVRVNRAWHNVALDFIWHTVSNLSVLFQTIAPLTVVKDSQRFLSSHRREQLVVCLDSVPSRLTLTRSLNPQC